MVPASGDLEREREPIIRVRGLLNRFGEQTVHEHLDLDVRRGEVIGIVGGSGSGKSVLLRSIVGLMTPSAGEILVFGANLSRLEDRERRLYERRWGILFQDGALFSSLTVQQNVEAPLKEHFDLPPAVVADFARLKVSLAGLPLSACAKYPRELSGGMRKRAGIARALACDPEILFLDEPTAGLDPIGAEAFDELIATLKVALGLTVFLVTHDLDTLYRITDRVAVLGEKRIIAIAPVAELEDDPYPWIQAYFLGKRGRAARRAVGASGTLAAPLPATKSS